MRWTLEKFCMAGSEGDEEEDDDSNDNGDYCDLMLCGNLKTALSH